MHQLNNKTLYRWKTNYCLFWWKRARLETPLPSKNEKMAREKDKTNVGGRARPMKQVKSICAWVLDSFVSSSPPPPLPRISPILGRLLGRDEASLGRRTFTRVFMFYLGSTAPFFLAVAGFSSGQEMGRDYNTNKVKQNRDTRRRVSTWACLSFFFFFSLPESITNERPHPAVRKGQLELRFPNYKVLASLPPLFSYYKTCWLWYRFFDAFPSQCFRLRFFFFFRLRLPVQPAVLYTLAIILGIRK